MIDTLARPQAPLLVCRITGTAPSGRLAAGTQRTLDCTRAAGRPATSGSDQRPACFRLATSDRQGGGMGYGGVGGQIRPALAGRISHTIPLKQSPSSSNRPLVNVNKPLVTITIL